MSSDTRTLLRECADMYVVCDDGTRIPCSRFHVSTRCAVLRWVAEDVGVARDIPVPLVSSRTLALALDVVHGLRDIAEYALAEVDLARAGFDVLGCDIDTAPREWALLEPSATIDDLRPRLAALIRSSVGRSAVLRRAIVLAPGFDDLVRTLKACQPDTALSIYCATALAHMYPAGALVRELLKMTPGVSLDDALRIAGCDGVGTYMHPAEVAAVAVHVRDMFRNSHESAAWGYVRSVASAMHTFDAAPASCSAFNGSVISFHDSQSTSVMLSLDGAAPRRRLTVAKWLKVSLAESLVVSVRAHLIDQAAQLARCLDVRVFVETSSGHRAEMMYSWRAPAWIPQTEVSTSQCATAAGDPGIFENVVAAGKFARKMTVRIDTFYGATSIVDRPLVS